MFLAERLIYLQMHKTGCSHITKVLSKAMPGETREPHSKLTFDPGNRVILGSVRNPWDWYVSLWAYGCAGKGAVYSALTARKRSIRRLAHSVRAVLPDVARASRALGQWLTIDDSCRKRWRFLYGDPEDVQLFRRWLHLVLSQQGKNDLIEGYPEANVRRCAGFMTYRFVSLYSDHRKWNSEGQYINDVKGLRAFFAEYSILDKIIRMEHLQHDLVQILKELEYEVDPAMVGEDDRTNTSRHLPYKTYYDAATERLVADQEHFIVERYGYVPPSAASSSMVPTVTSSSRAAHTLATPSRHSRRAGEDRST